MGGEDGGIEWKRRLNRESRAVNQLLPFASSIFPFEYHGPHADRPAAKANERRGTSLRPALSCTILHYPAASGMDLP